MTRAIITIGLDLLVLRLCYPWRTFVGNCLGVDRPLFGVGEEDW